MYVDGKFDVLKQELTENFEKLEFFKGSIREQFNSQAK